MKALGVILESAGGDLLAQPEEHPIPGCLKLLLEMALLLHKDNLAMGASSLEHLPFLPHGVASALG